MEARVPPTPPRNAMSSSTLMVKTAPAYGGREQGLCKRGSDRPPRQRDSLRPPRRPSARFASGVRGGRSSGISVRRSAQRTGADGRARRARSAKRPAAAAQPRTTAGRQAATRERAGSRSPATPEQPAEDRLRRPSERALTSEAPQDRPVPESTELRRNNA